MAQGDSRTGTKGMNAIFVLDHEQIANIPKKKTVTYARLVVDFRPQKDDPNRVRMTAGGNLIEYAGELTTRTADLSTAKIVWNSVISTPDARFACFDISNMNLYTSSPLTTMNICAARLTCSPNTPSINMNWGGSRREGSCTSRFAVLCTDFLRQEHWPTNC